MADAALTSESVKRPKSGLFEKIKHVISNSKENCSIFKSKAIAKI